MHFSGRNSFLYQVFSVLQDNIRLAKLPSEMLNKKGQVIKIKFGDVISPNEYGKFSTREELIKFLRGKTYELAD